MCRKDTNIASGRGGDGREGGREGQDKGKGTFFCRSHDIDEGPDWRACRVICLYWMIANEGWTKGRSQGGNDETRRRMSGWSAASGQFIQCVGFHIRIHTHTYSVPKKQIQINN